MPVQYVETIMSREVVSISGDLPLSKTLEILSGNKISFVVISQGTKPIGVITERDIVRFTAEHIDISHLTANDVMSTPVMVFIGSEVDVTEAYHRLKLAKKRHLVIVNKEGDIEGVITLTDFIKHLGVEAFIEHKPLSHVLTADPVHVTPDTITIDAIKLMMEKRISCMIITEEEKPVGILTERDIARIRVENLHDLHTTPIGDIMTKPLITVFPSTNTSDASNMMADNNIRHLVVVDQKGYLIGVVTETNIVRGMEGRYVKSLVELLDRKDNELRAINETLEKRVRQRTQELEAEMEAHKIAQESMRKLTLALEQAGEAVLITDTEGNIEYINESFVKTTGYTWPEVQGKNPSMLQSGRQDTSFYQDMWQTLLNVGAWQGVVWNKRKNGEIYPEQLHIRSIKNDQGKVINYVGTFSDITEKMAIEEERRYMQRMKAIGSLVGGVAHNFNNILAGMVGSLYIAKNEAKILPNVVSQLNSVESLIEQASDIVRQLLTFARKEVTEKCNINIVPLMKEALETSRLGIPEDIQLLSEFTGDSLSVYGDAAQLQQVLMNMVHNARDAMTEAMPRTIAVSLKSFSADEHFMRKHEQLTSNSLACLTIEDSGSGIAESDLEHIFEPFYTTKEVGKGTGLGLSMSKGAIESHGGAVEVESTLGKGTVFRIYLPLVEELPASPSATEAEASHGKGELILLVDDEKVIIESTRNVLQAFGYRVITASNGADAYETFLEQMDDVALVITDIVMPKKGGYELTRNIHEHKNVPVILMTGYDFEQKKEDYKPGTATLAKPFKVQQLMEAITALLQKNSELL